MFALCICTCLTLSLYIIFSVFSFRLIDLVSVHPGSVSVPSPVLSLSLPATVPKNGCVLQTVQVPPHSRVQEQRRHPGEDQQTRLHRKQLQRQVEKSESTVHGKKI